MNDVGIVRLISRVDLRLRVVSIRIMMRKIVVRIEDCNDLSILKMFEDMLIM